MGGVRDWDGMDLESRCAAYREARERAEKIAKAEALKVEAWSLLEKRDVLMAHWAGVSWENRPDSYHAERRSLDDQMYHLAQEINKYESVPTLAMISELNGLPSHFLKQHLSSLKGKKKPDGAVVDLTLSESMRSGRFG